MVILQKIIRQNERNSEKRWDVSALRITLWESTSFRIRMVTGLKLFQPDNFSKMRNIKSPCVRDFFDSEKLGAS